jgi:amidase
MKCCKAVLLLSLFLVLGIFLGCGKNTAQTSLNSKPVYYQSATKLAKALKNGEISSVQLLDVYLKRIGRYNPKINAVVAMDVKAARIRAAAADAALAQGKSWGPLHGLPMTVKDVFEAKGMPATSGNSKLKNHLPKQNALAVQRLEDAGAIIFGKTNTPLFASDLQTYNKVYGVTNNPWDLSKTPGGSSGGSAAALAMGFTPLELGSDLGGSLRVPAHFTGVYGHRPSFGLVPRLGHIPPMPGTVPPFIMPKLALFVVGPMARSAGDLGLALEVLTTAGKSSEGFERPKLLPAPKKKLSDYRVAVWFKDQSGGIDVDAQVQAGLKKAVEKLKAAGVKVEEASPDFDLAQDRQLFLAFYRKIMARQLPDEPLYARQKKQQAKWAAFFKNYDVLLAPVTRTLAFPHNNKLDKKQRQVTVNGQKVRYLSNLGWCLMAVTSGLPATAAPVGFSQSGLPLGVQIIGDRFKDRTTIAFAKGMSKILGGFVPPPGYKN